MMSTVELSTNIDEFNNLVDTLEPQVSFYGSRKFKNKTQSHSMSDLFNHFISLSYNDHITNKNDLLKYKEIYKRLRNLNYNGYQLVNQSRYLTQILHFFRSKGSFSSFFLEHKAGAALSEKAITLATFNNLFPDEKKKDRA